MTDSLRPSAAGPQDAPQPYPTRDPWEGTDEEDMDDDDGRECFHCGGEGWDECDDPIECTNAHHVIHNPDGSYVGQLCRCSSCGGSGLAKDMTIW